MEGGEEKRFKEKNGREKGKERNWMVCVVLPRFVSDFIIMRVQEVVRRVNWKNGITSNHWPSLRQTKPRGEHPLNDHRGKGLAIRRSAESRNWKTKLVAQGKLIATLADFLDRIST